MIKIMTKIKISKLIFIFQIRDQDLYPAMLLSTIERQNHCFRTSYVISRAGNSRSCTRFCVEYACLMRKVQGSNPGGCLMTFYDLLFFHHF